MQTSIFYFNILAIELPSLRIFPLIRIAAIVSLYAVAVLFIVIYIQLIGSGTVIFSGLFHVTFISQGIENFCCLVDALILMPWSLTNSVNLCLEHLCSTEELAGLLLSSLPLVKLRLTKVEQGAFSLPKEFKDILVGLLLGDLSAEKQTLNVRLRFKQSTKHKDYLNHLFELFSTYCPNVPKTNNLAPDKRTGKVYSNIWFNTYSLPCFAELYNLFYLEGKKVIPLNIGELLTPLGLAYWLCDDGSFCKARSIVTLCTESFILKEVNLLANILNDKWNLNCYINKTNNGGARILIPRKSLPVLQSFLKDIMPIMMRHKIGL
jgi:hypothetical protein